MHISIIIRPRAYIMNCVHIFHSGYRPLTQYNRPNWSTLGLHIRPVYVCTCYIADLIKEQLLLIQMHKPGE